MWLVELQMGGTCWHSITKNSMLFNKPGNETRESRCGDNTATLALQVRCSSFNASRQSDYTVVLRESIPKIRQEPPLCLGIDVPMHSGAADPYTQSGLQLKEQKVVTCRTSKIVAKMEW